MAASDAPARAKAVENGNNIITLTPEQVQVWKDAAATQEADWVAEMNGKGYDGQALLDQAKALTAKYTK
ncbi:hypothetical protein CGU37_28385 [Pseudomonas fluorescens]|nr:hypothetical protein CGU37_28385 [Pseudomonas fluorescens]